MIAIKTNINVAKDFSPNPAGRFPSDGEFSGQRFREELLLPALKTNEKITIDFDGTEGYGSSFLDEAFGGLVRAGYQPQVLRDRLSIKSEEDPSVIQEIIGYIEDEKLLAK